MKVKKLICLSLLLLMVLSSAGCEDGGLTTPSAPAEKSSDTDTSAEKKTDSVSAEDISVTWQDSRVYTDLTLGRYTEITTYGMKGYEDVPFIKLSDYAGILFGGTERITVQDVVMTVTVNGSEITVDPETDTMLFTSIRTVPRK